MTDGDVERLVVVVTGVDSGETLERWQFNVSVQEEKEEVKGMETDENGNTLNVEKTKEKTEKKSGKSLQGKNTPAVSNSRIENAEKRPCPLTLHPPQKSTPKSQP